MSSTRLGSLVSQHRRRLGLTQQQLAEMVGVHQTRVSHWERGSRTPTLQQMDALGDLFGLSSKDFLVEYAFDNDVERALLRDPLLEQSESAALLTIYRSLIAMRVGGTAVSM